ncbi:DNA polymerase Y family protein [Lysobacter korlensis]|uniref:DNA polymerase Y family protein n=1 Tax=Lysobacter korlensis TaxID=553636 RepID=A0ABV6RPN1_9GAMM
MRWACLLLPRLALDVVLRTRPDPQRPLVLLTGPALRRVVHSANEAARALGLHPGQPWATAQAIADGFDRIDHDESGVEQARELLAGWAYGYSSQVSLAFAHAVVLEIGRSRRLFGDWPTLEPQLRAELQAMGFSHRLAAAPNPWAAHVLARVRDGLSVDHDGLPSMLHRVPVERSGLAHDVVQTLRRMGLHDLRAVLAQSRAALGRRCGAEALRHLDRLSGLIDEPLACYRPADVFQARIELGYEVESSQALLFPLRRLTADLGAHLRARDGGVARFVLVLEHERRPASEVVVGLLAPEREATMLFELARGRLEQAQIPAPVIGFGLRADALPAFVPERRDLFDTRPQQGLPWAQLRERLRARLGDESVLTLEHHPDHRPERAWRAQAVQSRRPAPQLLLTPAGSRPGWLLREPQPLDHDVATIVAGPERIESGWWDGFDIRRDYYLVETVRGRLAWVFCDAGRHGPLMVHGWFA